MIDEFIFGYNISYLNDNVDSLVFVFGYTWSVEKPEVANRIQRTVIQTNSQKRKRK